MQFKEIYFKGIVSKTKIPADLNLVLPRDIKLPKDQQHFLIYIPWQEKYLELIPTEFIEIFKNALPHLKVRTTDVHVAICMGYLDILLDKLCEPVNRRVVALALILHDSGWSQMTELEIANSLGVKGLKLNNVAIGPKEKHVEEGLKVAKDVLTSCLFNPLLTEEETNLVYKAILYHDKPELVAGSGKPMPMEIQVLADLDHLWSFTHENFWQDTVRKGVEPTEYLQNLAKDLHAYFVTDESRQLASELLAQRAEEVNLLGE